MKYFFKGLSGALLFVIAGIMLSWQISNAQQPVPTPPIATSIPQTITGTVNQGTAGPAGVNDWPVAVCQGITCALVGVLSNSFPPAGINGLVAVGLNYQFDGANYNRMIGNQTSGLLASPGPYPFNESPLIGSSGNTGAAAASATLAATPSAFTYLCNMQITFSPATTGTTVAGTITGITGGGTFTYIVTTPTAAAGVTVSPQIMTFTPCLKSSAVNTAIVASVPALGAGANLAVNVSGFVGP